MSPVWSIGAAIAGGLSGPWLRATILTNAVPYGHPPRQRCPHCLHLLIREGQFGILTRRPASGRCPYCDKQVGPALASIEIAAGVALGVLALRAPGGWQAVGWCWFALCGIMLAAVDLAVHRLPAPIVTAAALGVMACLLGDTFADAQPQLLLRALASASVLTGLYLFAVLVPRRGMGPGDMALAVPIGLVTGWTSIQATMLATAAAILTAGVVTVWLLLTRNAKRHDELAFGPYMVLGALIALAIYR